MTGKEHKAYIKEIRDYKEQLLKSDDEIKAFLKAIGIYTKTGNFNSGYIEDNMEFKCKYCQREMHVSFLAFKQNSYCNDCFDDRADALIKRDNIDITTMTFFGYEIPIPKSDK